MMNRLVQRIKHSNFLKDSFWSVFGNGMGNGLLLIGGILIARILGKDLYGEYGMVKTTMFYLAAFSTFGLGYTTTKYIANAIEHDSKEVVPIVNSAIRTTFIFSLFICILLFIFADQLAAYINSPKLSMSFRFLGIIMVCKAISTTQTGILAGYKSFKALGVNNIISGAALVISCIPLTYAFSVNGSLLALTFSQFVLCLLNGIHLKRMTTMYPDGPHSQLSYTKELLRFSLPVALQELSYTLCNWGAMLIITKYSNIGEVGIYSAATQWSAIILFIPSLLQNVILSYLSGLEDNKDTHRSMVFKMILINLVCSAVPFLLILLCSQYIITFYGETFSGLRIVLNTYALGTIFMCLSNVFQADLLARGYNWVLFFLRVGRDAMIISTLFLIVSRGHIAQTAFFFAMTNVIIYAIFTTILCIFTIWISYNKNNKQNHDVCQTIK